jgi:hypothetical protein
MSFVFFLFDFFVIIFIYFYFILFHFIIHHTFIFFNSQDFTALVGLQAYTRMPGLGFIYIYIYIEGVDGKIYKQCGKWCVVYKTRSFRPPHGGQKIRAVPLLLKNKT